MITLQKRTTGLLAGLCLGISVIGVAHAQDESIEIEEIVVIGVKGSLQRSLAQKRAAVGVVDAVSAEDLGKFPELNISESIQRVPGVTLNRGNGGEGQSVNLRGLGPDFTRVEINGMTGVGNGTTGVFGGTGGGRGFNFEILPSELFTNVAINKTADASQSEGGLAGIMYLRTPKPFDYDGFRVSGSVQGNQSDNADDIGTRAALHVSNNFNDRWGVSGSVVYTDTQFQSNRTGGFNVRPLSLAIARDDNGDPVAGTPEELAASITNVEHYIHDFEDAETIAFHGALQFAISDDAVFSLDAIVSDRDATRFFTRADAPSESNITSVSNTVVENGLITSGTFSGVQQRLGINDNSSEESLTQITADIDWNLSDSLSVTPFVGYTKREIERTGNLLSMRRGWNQANGGFDSFDVSYTYRGDFVDWTTTGTDFSSNPEEFVLNVFLLRPNTDDDEEVAAKLDFKWDSQGGPLSSVDFGFRYSDRDIVRTGADTRVVGDAGVNRLTGLPTVADALVTLGDFNIDGAPASVPGSWISANPAQLLSLYLPNGLDGAPVTGASVVPLPLVTAQRSFDVSEQTFNLYSMANFEVGDLAMNAGLRWLRTEQTSRGFQIVNGNPSPISSTNTYWEVLPSASLRYAFSDNLYLRAAYSKSLTRPSLGDLAPTENVNGVDEGGGTGSQGNPNLRPFSADNIDLGIEYYFAGNDGIISANVFYKQLDGIIDTESFTEDRAFPRQADNVIVTGPIVFTRPANGVSASIRGFELAVQTPLSLDEGSFWNNVGVLANATFTESSAEFQDAGDIRSTGLPGLSEESYNVSAYYDDGRFDARIAYAWRSDFLQAFSGAFGIPRFQEDFGQLDFAANYRVTENFVLQLQGLNLTDEQVVYTSSSLRAPNAVTQIDRRLIFGARYTF